MIPRILSNNIYFSSQKTSYLLSSFKTRIIPISYYHSDSIGTITEEKPFDEQRLSSQEATGILRTHEASIDLEANCPVKYYEVNYLGANNPPGMCHILISFYLLLKEEIEKNKYTTK
jgi:hypothetical protein